MSNFDLAKQVVKLIVSAFFASLAPKKKTNGDRLRSGPTRASNDNKMFIATLAISTIISVGLMMANMYAPSTAVSDDYKELYKTTFTQLAEFTNKATNLLEVNSKLTASLEQRNRERDEARAASAEMTLLIERLEEDIDTANKRYIAALEDNAVLKDKVRNLSEELEAQKIASEKRATIFKEKEAKLLAQLASINHRPTKVAQQVVPKKNPNHNMELSNATRARLLNLIQRSSKE